MAKTSIEGVSGEQGALGEKGCAPSVTMPSVPSAPMNLSSNEPMRQRERLGRSRSARTYILVVSQPAADLRARWRVLMTSPLGRTTVCAKETRRQRARRKPTAASSANTDQVEEPLGSRRTVSDGVGARASVSHRERLVGGPFAWGRRDVERTQSRPCR